MGTATNPRVTGSVPRAEVDLSSVNSRHRPSEDLNAGRRCARSSRDCTRFPLSVHPKRFDENVIRVFSIIIRVALSRVCFIAFLYRRPFWPKMDDRHSPIMMTTANGKKTMSRSFLIDSLIGGVKQPAAAAVPYHPQLNEYIQFLNRTAAAAAAAAAYRYQPPAPAFQSAAASAIAAGPRYFGYHPAGFGKDQHHQRSPAVVKPVPVVAAAQRSKGAHHHAKTLKTPKRSADEISFDTGKRIFFFSSYYLLFEFAV